MEQRTKIGAVIFLVLIGAALYLPSLSVPYIYDDYPHFVENTRVQSPDGWRDVFKNGTQETRPIFNASLWAQSALFGTDSHWAHGVNVALHLFCAVLLYFLLLTWTNEKWLAVGSAVVFLIHPIAVETVVYFNSRSGLLAQFFGFLGLLFVFSEKKRNFALGLLFFACALGSKEDAVSFVLLVALLRLGFGKRTIGNHELSGQRFLMTLSTLVIIPIIYALFQSPHIDTVGFTIDSPLRYFLNQGSIVPLHLSLFFLPWPLTLDREVGSWMSAVPVLILGWCFLLVLVGIVWRKRGSWIALGIGWALLSLAPTHSFVPVLDVHATRILYPMLPGLSLALVATLTKLSKVSQRIAIVLFVTLSIAMAGKTTAQIRLWKDPVALWTLDVTHAPHRWRAWTNLAIELAEQKRWKEAEVAIVKAFGLAPKNPQVLYNYAAILVSRGHAPDDRRKALAMLEEVLVMAPQHKRALRLWKKLRKKPL